MSVLSDKIYKFQVLALADYDDKDLQRIIKFSVTKN